MEIFNEKIWQAVIDLISELIGEHERNVNNISCDDLYLFPMKKKMYQQSKIRHIMSHMSTQIE